MKNEMSNYSESSEALSQPGHGSSRTKAGGGDTGAGSTTRTFTAGTGREARRREQPNAVTILSTSGRVNTRRSRRERSSIAARRARRTAIFEGPTMYPPHSTFTGTKSISERLGCDMETTERETNMANVDVAKLRGR